MKVFFAGIFLLFCASCTTTRYYYPTLSSNDLDKSKDGVFVSDGDSILIAYSFAGENAPLRIDVRNKMKDELHIDWTKSWVEIGDDRVFYSDFVDEINSVLVVHPESQRHVSMLRLSHLSLDRVGKIDHEKDFTEANSPLVFTSHLSLHVGKLGDEPIELENQFYVSKIIRSQSAPQAIPSLALDRGDVFFVKSVKKHGEWAKTVGGVVAFVSIETLLGTSMGVALGENSNDAFAESLNDAINDALWNIQDSKREKKENKKK